MQWCKEFMSIRGLSDYIEVYENVISKQTCDHFISLYDSSEAKHMKTPAYDFGEINMFESAKFKEYTSQISQLMSGIYQRYSSQYEFFPQTSAFEQPRIKRYEPNEGIFNWHCDASTKETNKRILVMFFYLNDVEEGGETRFKDMSVKPKAGSVVCFPPTWQYPHKGCTPISGPKYVISSYVQI